MLQENAPCLGVRVMVMTDITTFLADHRSATDARVNATVAPAA